MITREQRRMNETWLLLIAPRGPSGTGGFGPVSDWTTSDEPRAYLRHLKRTPARIHTSGLGQAIAFLRSRSGKEGRWARKAADDLGTLTLTLLGIHATDLIAEIRARDAGFVFLATEECMAVIEWLTRYLEGAGVRALVDEDEAESRTQEGGAQAEETRL